MLKATFSPEYETLLSMLKQSRLDQDLSQVELAKRLGVHQSVVSKNERGERRMDVLELRDRPACGGCSLPALSASEPRWPCALCRSAARLD